MTAQNMAFVLVKGAEGMFGKELSYRVALYAVATLLYRANLISDKDYTTGYEHEWPSYESYWKEVEELIINEAEQYGKKEGLPGHAQSLQPPDGQKGPTGNTSGFRDDSGTKTKQ